jgi:hypothetical protein
MNTFTTRIFATAAVAALIAATPLSLAAVRPVANGADGQARLSLILDAAQAHERGGAGAGRHASADRGIAGRDGGRGIEAGRGTDARANNVRANNVRANDVRVNNVNVNNVDARRVAPYAQPAYAPWAAAATVAAAGTAVAVLPPSCAAVSYDGATYYQCGNSFYVASNGGYVAVNPPR